MPVNLDLCNCVCVCVFCHCVSVCIFEGGVFLGPSCFSLSPPLGQRTQQVFSCKEELVQFGPLYGNLEWFPLWFCQNDAEWFWKFFFYQRCVVNEREDRDSGWGWMEGERGNMQHELQMSVASSCKKDLWIQQCCMWLGCSSALGDKWYKDVLCVRAGVCLCIYVCVAAKQ